MPHSTRHARRLADLPDREKGPRVERRAHPPRGIRRCGSATRICTMANPERHRLEEADGAGVPWRRWGPYLSERQWGTVREDYSSGGDAWSYFTHEQARSRAYRWGEDGIAGVSDDRQVLC